MPNQLYDNRLDDYLGNIDHVADGIAAQISYEFIDTPSLEQIQNEIIPKFKKSLVQVGSQAADWTIVSSFKMGTEAIVGKTAAGSKLSSKERALYGASVSLTALSYALWSYAVYTGDPTYALLWWKTYAGSRWFFLLAKSKQTLDALHGFANAHNIQSLKKLLKKYDDIFASASDKELEEIDKKIHQ
jgi:hypothetical protein